MWGGRIEYFKNLRGYFWFIGNLIFNRDSWSASHLVVHPLLDSLMSNRRLEEFSLNKHFMSETSQLLMWLLLLMAKTNKLDCQKKYWESKTYKWCKREKQKNAANAFLLCCCWWNVLAPMWINTKIKSFFTIF